MLKPQLVSAVFIITFFITPSSASCNGDSNAKPGCGINCNKHCSDLNKPPRACILLCKLNSCDCKDGYYYDDNLNKCVLPEQCTPTCKKDEVYSTCINSSCQAQNCSQVGFPIPCPRIDPAYCVSGCICKDGYVRAENGTCIPINECPSCGGDPNALSGCGVNCNKHCSDLNGPPKGCIKICNINSCDCKDGFYYDENINKCVRPKQCTPTCKANEVYDSCANSGCRKWNCSDGGIHCIDSSSCKGGCICRDGYLRDDDGNCIPEDQCPTCNGPNEFWDSCAPSCPPQICESIGKKYNCPLQPAVCKGACRCKKGYYRNNIGKCISEKDCQKCQGPHEYFSCGGACDNVCATLDKQNQTDCPIKNIVCNHMCYCEKDYARDDKNICVPINECPISCGGDPNAEPGCGLNCNKHCSNYGKPNGICPRIACPPKGCECKDGYYFDPNIKKCVLPKQCTPTCKANEVYDSCANSGCRKWNCSDGGILCIDSSNCEGGCICRDGYLRDDDGNCIPEDQCPISCGGDRNAEPGCGLNCNKHCSNYGKPHGICPRIACPPKGCECKDGYYFDPNIKKCVLPEQCTQACNQNENYDSCANGGCRRWRCSDPGKICVNVIKCEGGCVCNNGYLRDNNGICIPEDRCPSQLVTCNGDPNAVSGCGINCGKRCSDYKKSGVACPDICLVGGCDCKQNYVFDDNIHKCVLPHNCTPTCKANEVYDSCANSGCRKWNCSNKGILCIDSFNCEGGCICRDGYLRGDDGNCIPEDQCPTPKTTTLPLPATINTRTTEALARFNKGSIALSGEFLYQLLESQPNSNFVLSATSLLIPLGELAYFATGEVLDQLLRVLNLKNKEEIKNVFPRVIADYENQTQVIFEVENKYYANINYPLSKSFKQFSKDIFHSTAENTDFSKNTEAANKINSWVEERTHGKIKNLVTPDMFNAQTRLVLLNALYFLGNWLHQFDPNKTEKLDFYKDDKNTVKIPIMYQENNFKYCEDDNMRIQALEMPYKNSNFSFLIILPRDKGTNAVKTVASKLKNPDVFTGIIEKMRYEKVKAYIPRMLISTTLDLAEMLKKDNVTEMFNPESDGFRDILERSEPVYVSAAVQKCFISVDETGTEAAAATAIGFTTTSAIYPPPKIYVFEANRPYVMYILLHGISIFCGAFFGAS